MFASPSHGNHLESDPFSWQMSSTAERRTAIFWDYDLCPLPDGVSGALFVRRVREMARVFSSSTFAFKAYFTSPIGEGLRSELRDSNVAISEEKGITVDKLRKATEMFAFAMDQPSTLPGAVIFISSDPDYACVLSALQNKGHLVGLLCPVDSPDSSLKAYANHTFSWSEAVESDAASKIVDLDESLINFEAVAVVPQSPPQQDWARPPPTPPRTLSSDIYSDLRSVQPAILNHDLPRQDSAPPSPERRRTDPNPTNPGNTPPATGGQVHSIFKFTDLVHVLEEAGPQEHIWSKISELLRERNPDYLVQAKISKFGKYLEAAEEAGIVTNRRTNTEGWVTLNPRDRWRVAL